MTRKEALDKSIRHWKENLKKVKNAENTILDLPLGELYCALCQKYAKNSCSNCPLMNVGQCCAFAHSIYARIEQQHKHLREALRSFRNICKRMLVTLETARGEK